MIWEALSMSTSVTPMATRGHCRKYQPISNEGFKAAAKRGLVMVALIVPSVLTTCTLLAVKFATQSDPVSVLNVSSAGPFVAGLVVVLKSRPGPFPAGKRTSVVPVEFAPKFVTTISPGLREPGVVDAETAVGAIAMP